MPRTYRLCHRSSEHPAKMSIGPSPQDTAPGSEVRVSPYGPPRFSQGPLDHPVSLTYHLCRNLLSPPRAKTSSRPSAHDDTSGPEARTPPSFSQPDQPRPRTYDLCHKALSEARAKTSIRPSPQDTAVGSEVRVRPDGAPNFSHDPLDHPWPLTYHLWRRRLSPPRAKTSSRPSPQEDTSGPEARTPPSFSQPDHPRPRTYDLCHKALSEARAKTSIRPSPQDTALGSEVKWMEGVARSMAAQSRLTEQASQLVRLNAGSDRLGSRTSTGLHSFWPPTTGGFAMHPKTSSWYGYCVRSCPRASVAGAGVSAGPA